MKVFTKQLILLGHIEIRSAGLYTSRIGRIICVHLVMICSGQCLKGEIMTCLEKSKISNGSIKIGPTIQDHNDDSFHV